MKQKCTITKFADCVKVGEKAYYKEITVFAIDIDRLSEYAKSWQTE